MMRMENAESKKNFAGLRVLSLESRRGPEMAKLIASYGGEAVVAPSMREVPLETNTAALAFVRALLAGEFDMVIFLTGVGTRALARVAETVYPARAVSGGAAGSDDRCARTEADGCSSGMECSRRGHRARTEYLARTVGRTRRKRRAASVKGCRVAVQEYGVTNAELLAGLEERGAQVTSVPVYEWALPADTAPLRSAITAIARNEIDVILFTTATQADHLLQIAAEMLEEDRLRRALSRMLVASIGPTTSERLRELGIVPDMEPTHPKMGFLVSEAAQRSAEIWRRKRGARVD